MTTSLRERRKQMLRDEILEAARALLSEKGYAAMSMDDLALHVGISKPTLYSHFATKNDIVVATMLRELERFIALIETQHAGRTPLQHLIFLLQKMIEIHLHEIGIDPKVWTPEVFQLLCSREDGMNAIRRVDAAITALVEDGLAAGEINAQLQPSMVVAAFHALGSALRHLKFLHGTLPTLMEAMTLVTIFECGVAAPRLPKG